MEGSDLRSFLLCFKEDLGKFKHYRTDSSSKRAPTRGPPIPLLFVFVVDCLGRLMDKAQQNNIFSPGQSKNQASASIYADDDVIIFLKPELHDFEVVTKILKLFGEASGLTTNLSKSKIVPIRCDGIVRLISLPFEPNGSNGPLTRPLIGGAQPNHGWWAPVTRAI